MNKSTVRIWGRNFDLEVYYKKFQGKNVNLSQQEAYDKFLESEDIIEKSYRKVVSYIEDNYKNNLEEDRIENIFRYIIPKTIYIPNDAFKRKIVILCDFKYDIEHGLAIVYENEELVKISSQDDVL